MLSKIYFLLFASTLLFTFGCDEPQDFGGCPFPEDVDQSYDLVWSDEFDGEEIDASKWSYDIGDGCDRGICGWGNNELEYYTDRPENSFISNGNLIIKANREQYEANGNTYGYTSARMVTKNKGDFRFGRIDVRAKIPKGQGLWPAIWMLPTDNVYGGWPKSGEIDIMESIGSTPEKILGTIHFGNEYWRFVGDEYRLEEGDFSQDFHIYTVLWSEDCIKFLVDGIEYSGPYTRSTTLPQTWPFDQDFHILLNVAVGGTLPGNPTPATLFPQVMQVDYVRVYQEKQS